MRHGHYTRFEAAELILRDQLAIDRTLLANERTFLSYLRSAVALLLAGVSIIHFSHQLWFTAVGIACVPVAVFTGFFGLWKFRKMNDAISVISVELRHISEPNQQY
jgi:putative membrane protein